LKANNSTDDVLKWIETPAKEGRGMERIINQQMEVQK
jgi:hypothetical protein